MSWLDHQHKESGVRAGLGTGFCYKKPDESKYHIFAAVESMPEVSGTRDNIEYSTTTNEARSNVAGKLALENPEISLPYNLDNIKKLNELNGQTLDFAYIDLDDFTGIQFSGSISYRVGEIGVDSVKTIIVTVTTASIESEIVEDLYDVYEDTVQFGTVPVVLKIEVGKTQTIKVATTPSATLTSTSEAATVATATVDTSDASAIKFEGKAAGSTIVEISAAVSGYASNKKYVKVIVVPAA